MNREYQEQIKTWVSIDDEIKELNIKVKELRDKKQEYSNIIINYANEHNLLNAVFQLPDSKLKFNNEKTTQPLTFQYVEHCLKECIENEEIIKQIIQYMKENRDVKSALVLKRFQNTTK